MQKKEKKIEEALTRGVDTILPSKEELKKLLLEKDNVRVYQGFDPSAPSLHLGNLVGVLKLAQLQEAGCEIIFLVGDFTGMIGDPTDKASARKKLTRKEVLENAEKWKKQVDGILDFSSSNPAEIKYNSSWLDKVSFRDLIEITSNFTVQQMIQRDFFQRRLEKEEPIFLHEFLYPVAQAFDSVEMDVDLEVGGTDQTFNMLTGRTLMKKMKGKEKFVLSTKLLTDKEGKKVGKTTGGAVFLDMKPEEIYGRIMSFPDETIVPGFELLTRVEMKRMEEIRRGLEEGRNPMKAKKELAFEIVKLVKDKEQAESAEKHFERVFEKHKRPKKIRTVKIEKKEVRVADLLVEAELCSSKSEAKRLVKQGAVRIDDEKVKDWRKKIKPEKGVVVQVGKRRFVEIE